MHTIESWVNPFKSRNATEPLVNIASAVKATDSITDDLRTAEKKGNAAFVSFVEKRLKSNEIDYLYAPLSKSNLQTFGNLVNSMTVNPFYTSHMASKYTHVTRTFGEKSMLQTPSSVSNLISSGITLPTCNCYTPNER